jgi:hypothetical protein
LKTGECYSIAFFLLVDTFLGFAYNSFEEAQAELAAFKKSFEKIREMYQPIERKGLKLIRELCMHSLSSKDSCVLKSIRY